MRNILILILKIDDFIAITFFKKIYYNAKIMRLILNALKILIIIFNIRELILRRNEEIKLMKNNNNNIFYYECNARLD